MQEMASIPKWAASSADTITETIRMKGIYIENIDVFNMYKVSVTDVLYMYKMSEPVFMLCKWVAFAINCTK